MRRAILPVAALVTALAMALVACGSKKRLVERQDFQAVTDYVDKNMRGASVGPEERRKYTESQLGAAHHVDGDVEYWYTPPSNCYYLQLGADGWASWGPGMTADCKKYAATK
ncbi:MAG TPA: hypothetical protein VIF09_28740 [Polyangiaceae bacterium]